jgi:aldehyde dehydrogenase (NAD+)
VKFLRGKFFNAGQTCITADYVLVHKDVEQELSDILGRYIKLFYGDNPKNSNDFPRIISKLQTKRLEGLLKYGDVVCGGEVVEEVKIKKVYSQIFLRKNMLPQRS